MRIASPEVTATLSLLQSQDADPLAADGVCGVGIDRAGFREISWHRLIAFSSAHFVLPAVAGPLKCAATRDFVPADVREFMAAIHDANSQRNALLLRSLREVTKALNSIGVTPCALKGAAILLDEGASGAAPWRFMSDIDLLVPDHSLASCVAAAKQMGFVASADTYDPSEEAHYPPLISPCGTFSIELHTRLFALDDFGLSTKPVWADAAPVNRFSGDILIPSMPHRLAHLLIHAQLHNRNFAIDRVVLKDVLDLNMLHNREPAGVCWRQPLAMFDTSGRREAAEALLAAWQRCSSSADVALSPAAIAWADRALKKLDWPRWRALLNLPVDMLRMEIHRFRSEHGHAGRRLRLLANPTRLADASANWAGKQRQRVWS